MMEKEPALPAAAAAAAGRRFDPAAHRPRSHRLRLGVCGAAGTVKTTFAASLAEAGLGRVCFFDTELKSCHVPGSDGSRFDAFEIADPDDLEAAIRWALRDEEGRARAFGAFALDSWNGWFGPTYARLLEAKRAATGMRFPELASDDLQRLQVVAGEILRLLCIDTRACVVITDTVAACDMEEREDYEVGRIVPISASGIEYAVDLLVEAELRLAPDGFSQTYVHRVVKSNVPAFAIGDELVNPTFRDYLARLDGAKVPTAHTVQEETTAAAAAAAVAQTAQPRIADLVEQLVTKAAERGIGRKRLERAAHQSYGKTTLNVLTREELEALSRRLDSVAPREPTAADAVPAAASAVPPEPMGRSGNDGRATSDGREAPSATMSRSTATDAGSAAGTTNPGAANSARARHPHE